MIFVLEIEQILLVSVQLLLCITSSDALLGQESTAASADRHTVMVCTTFTGLLAILVGCWPVRERYVELRNGEATSSREAGLECLPCAWIPAEFIYPRCHIVASPLQGSQCGGREATGWWQNAWDDDSTALFFRDPEEQCPRSTP